MCNKSFYKLILNEKQGTATFKLEIKIFNAIEKLKKINCNIEHGNKEGERKPFLNFIRSVLF